MRHDSSTTFRLKMHLKFLKLFLKTAPIILVCVSVPYNYTNENVVVFISRICWQGRIKTKLCLMLQRKQVFFLSIDACAIDIQTDQELIACDATGSRPLLNMNNNNDALS